MDDNPPSEPPTEPSPEPSMNGATPRSTARTAGLVATAFLGTLVVLLGLLLGFRGIAGSGGPATPSSSSAAVASASTGLSVTPASPTPVATASPSSAVPTGSPAPEPSRTPGPSPSGDPVLVGAGDIASCGLDSDEATARQVEGIAGNVFTAGDNAYESGSADDFKNCYDPTWGRFKDRTRPAAGNHDWVTPHAQGYRDYFGAAAVNADGKTWYSYNLGQWHIVVLDANCAQVDGCGADSDQGRWLTTDLAANRSFCTMAIWHQPRFSSGDEHGNDPEVDPFWRALYAAGADVVVNGHDHDYERFGPQDPAGHPDGARGIREFVVGTGGAAIRGFNPPVPNSELRLAIGPGVIKFTLHPRSYDWTWFSATTEVTDSGSAPCH